MFYFDEENNFIYESALNYYNARYPQHYTVQHELNDNMNIVDGEHVVDLLVNKVIVKIYPASSRTANAQEIWSGPDNESLAATVLAEQLLGSSSGIDSYLSYSSTIDQYGIRQPIFPKSGLVKINNEIISYDRRDDYKLYGLTRGLFGTTINTHSLNHPAGMATAVPITGPGHCAYPDILKRNDIAQINMLFILCFSLVGLVRL